MPFDLGLWSGYPKKEVHLKGSFRLAYNASMFVREGLHFVEDGDSVKVDMCWAK